MTQSNIRHKSVQDSAAASISDPRPDLSVIIVSWNVKPHLQACLQALFSDPVCDGLTLEVIVVDNASHDGSAEAAKAFPTFVLQSKTNLGYGRANNLGMKAAIGRHILILNPDTIPEPHSLRALIDFADKTPRAGIVAPRLLNPDGTTQNAAFYFPTLVMSLLDLFPLPAILPGRIRVSLLQSRLNGRYKEEGRSRPFTIEHPLGACFLIKRQAYEECGGFNPNIFMYSEEIDLALRYKAKGWEAWQAPASRVIHLGGQSTKQLPARMFVELWRSRLFIYDRYYSLPARLALRVLLVIAMLQRLVIAKIKSIVNKESRERSKQQLKAWRSTLRMALKR